MASTRVHFQAELARLEREALSGLDLVVLALGRAMESLVERDIELAVLVVADDDRIDGRYLEVHQSLLSLLATQAPVASDLRVAAALLHVVKHMERMGDQCVNIAKLVPLDGHEAPCDDRIITSLQRMSDVSISLISQAKLAFSERNADLARDLVRQDDEVDRLNSRSSAARSRSATTSTFASGRCTWRSSRAASSGSPTTRSTSASRPPS